VHVGDVVGNDGERARIGGEARNARAQGGIDRHVSQLHRRLASRTAAFRSFLKMERFCASWSARIRRAPFACQPPVSTERISSMPRVPVGVMTTGVVPEKSTPIILSRTLIVGRMVSPVESLASMTMR